MRVRNSDLTRDTGAARRKGPILSFRCAAGDQEEQRSLCSMYPIRPILHDRRALMKSELRELPSGEIINGCWFGTGIFVEFAVPADLRMIRSRYERRRSSRHPARLRVLPGSQISLPAENFHCVIARCNMNILVRVYRDDHAELCQEPILAAWQLRRFVVGRLTAITAQCVCGGIGRSRYRDASGGIPNEDERLVADLPARPGENSTMRPAANKVTLPSRLRSQQPHTSVWGCVSYSKVPARRRPTRACRISGLSTRLKRCRRGR